MILKIINNKKKIDATLLFSVLAKKIQLLHYPNSHSP